MIICNKIILSSYDFNYPLVLLLIQNVVSLLLVKMTRKYNNDEDVDKINWKIYMHFLPVNILFLSMVLTGVYTLKLLSVPMVTIFKNTNNILVCIGEYLIFRESVSQGTAVTLIVMLLASLLAASEDLEFDFIGYLWMIFNCFATTFYVLYIRYIVNYVRVSKFGMVYINSLLSIPFIFIGDMLLFGDIKRFLTDIQSKHGVDASYIDITNPHDYKLYILLILSGFLGFFLSISSFWCVERTSATTYSMVGSLNKIPITIIGALLFQSKITFLGGIYITLSLIAGTIFAITKSKEHINNNSNNQHPTSISQLPMKSQSIEPSLEISSILRPIEPSSTTTLSQIRQQDDRQAVVILVDHLHKQKT